MEFFNIFIAFAALVISCLSIRLSRITTKIAQDDKNEKTGHDLIFTLPMIYGKDTPFEGAHLRDFAIVNNKNRSEIINEFYLKKDDKTFPFWHAVQTPLVLPPYSTQLVRTNSGAPHIVGELSDYKIMAITLDDELEVTQKVMERKNVSG